VASHPREKDGARCQSKTGGFDGRIDGHVAIPASSPSLLSAITFPINAPASDRQAQALLQPISGSSTARQLVCVFITCSAIDYYEIKVDARRPHLFGAVSSPRPSRPEGLASMSTQGALISFGLIMRILCSFPRSALAPGRGRATDGRSNCSFRFNTTPGSTAAVAASTHYSLRPTWAPNHGLR